MSRLSTAAAIALVALIVLPPRVSAQLVRGQVIDAESQAPVLSGIVKATGSGTELSALTGSTGAFVLSLPNDFALESLTVERIGYESRVFRASELGDLQDLQLRVDSAPIQLGGIVTTGESLCRRQDGGPAVAAVWEEVRKSLEVTALSQQDRLVRFETQTWERDLRPSDYTVLRGTASQRTVTAASPYRSITVAEMTETGWVRGNAASGWELFAPDATLLLSDAFADQHCFRAEMAQDSAFLHFQPNQDRESHPELEGTLVLDARTSELRELRFTYVGVPEFRRGGRAGGEVRFFAAPNGLRVVEEWAIRAPVLSQVRQGFGSFAVDRLQVDRVREQGGRVLAVRADGETVELDSEPLDLGEPDSMRDPEERDRGVVASSRPANGGNATELVLRNEGGTPYRVTGVQLRDCWNTSVRCTEHPVDVTIPPGESRVVLQIGKERVFDPFRFEWYYVGEPLERADVGPDTLDPGPNPGTRF